jgi:hypothetical protein
MGRIEVSRRRTVNHFYWDIKLPVLDLSKQCPERDRRKQAGGLLGLESSVTVRFGYSSKAVLKRGDCRAPLVCIVGETVCLV